MVWHTTAMYQVHACVVCLFTLSRQLANNLKPLPAVATPCLLLGFWCYLVEIKSPKVQSDTGEWPQGTTRVPPSPPEPAMAKNSTHTCLWSKTKAFPVLLSLCARVPKCHFFIMKSNTTVLLTAIELSKYIPQPVRTCLVSIC